MADINEFERLIVDEIIKSLKNDSQLWEISIMGMERTSDSLELSISGSSEVEIHRPKKYKFQNNKEMKRLLKPLLVLRDKLRAERDARQEKDNIKILSNLFNLNSRKNKLKYLGAVSSKIEKLDTDKVKNEKSFWNKFKF